MRIVPFFELDGNRYEFKRTQWLIAEYRRLNEESPISDEDRAKASKASSLISDVKKFAEKEKDMWDKLCENPTEDNQRIYLMFKGMSDKAIEDYNAFISSNSALQNATKNSIDILEKVAIKALAEQYFSGNENIAKQTWEQFVDTMESHNKVAEWLSAMAECLFGEDENEQDTGFLAQKRRADMEKANNRNAMLRNKK